MRHFTVNTVEDERSILAEIQQTAIGQLLQVMRECRAGDGFQLASDIGAAQVTLLGKQHSDLEPGWFPECFVYFDGLPYFRIIFHHRNLTFD